VRTAYSVVVDDSKRGMAIDWYEGGQYIVSEEIPAYATLAASQPAYAPAKAGDVQIMVPEPVFDGTVEFAGTVEVPAASLEALDLLVKYTTNQLIREDNGDGTLTLTLLDDDDVTPLLTWTLTRATSTRSKAV
jgi:hypothetical protein